MSSGAVLPLSGFHFEWNLPLWLVGIQNCDPLQAQTHWRCSELVWEADTEQTNIVSPTCKCENQKKKYFCVNHLLEFCFIIKNNWVETQEFTGTNSFLWVKFLKIWSILSYKYINTFQKESKVHFLLWILSIDKGVTLCYLL